ncbi:MAG TPA: ABC transporter substrate-binding protein [Pseudonocardiaceae bacterium]|nr:ABC transporter substrate-binding protein [Pseudonocardiaceae bacterium]
MKTTQRRTLVAVGIPLVAVVLTLSACSRAGGDSSAAGAPSASATSSNATAPELHLGYFPNVTHAAALIGVDKGYFTKRLGSTKLTTQTFNAGPDEVSALLGGSLDAAFIGSGPSINAFSKSDGAAVRLIAGATSGGAELVVRPNITSKQDLVGKTIADPQLANTQDVSLKTYLSRNNLAGKVTVDNVSNSEVLGQFQKNTVQGGWLPEPYASELVLTGGAHVLVDESSLWPNGQFPTTVLIVRTQFLQQYPGTVKALIQGELDAINFEETDQSGAEAAVNDQLKQLTGKPLAQPVLDRAFSKIKLTADPLATDFPELVKDQVIAGIAKTAPGLTGFADLTQLNAVLKAAGKPAVSAGSLGGN